MSTNPDQAPDSTTARDEPTGTQPGNRLPPRVAEVVEAFLAAWESGPKPDRAAWVAAHPELAPHLDAALAGLEMLHPGPAVDGAVPKLPAQLGDFRVVREVGRGGMGVVYEAEQVSLRRRVALKVLRGGTVADAVALQRFQREAETVGHLHHTNIVPIFAVGEEDGIRYYAMQFIEGRDLGELARELRAAGRGRAARELAEWGLQAAEALAHAHQRGVIHRDIKPSNLILDPEGRIWLTDFGLARRDDDATLSQSGAMLGTPRYMSPEQASAALRRVDHRTDLYSLGATLYELATGRPIFEAPTAHEVIAQILRDEPRPPRQWVRDLPVDLETILLTCLAKDPAGRYASARALAEDLRAFLDGRPLQARRPGWPERAARWARRHRRLLQVGVASGAAAGVLVAGGIFGSRAWRRFHEGQVQWSAADSGHRAEVLDAAGRAVAEPWTLPMAQPRSLPAGSYQVRVSAPGRLSETLPVEVVRGALLSGSLRTEARPVWPPLAPAPGERWEVETLPRPAGTDLLVLIHDAGPDGKRPVERRLRRVAGATGQQVWELRFDADSMPAPEESSPATAEARMSEWRTLLQWPGIASTFERTGIGERFLDLDGDGEEDVVLVSRNSPSVTALSGGTGRVLWWHRARPEAPVGLAAGNAGRAFVVGRPAVLPDADGDGVADFGVCFHAGPYPGTFPSDGAPRRGPENWISVVSGRSGRELWRRAVGGAWGEYVSSSSAFASLDALIQPRTGQVGGRRVVVLASGDRVAGWELAGGTPAWEPWTQEPRWDSAPALEDLDGDGDAEMLVGAPESGHPAARGLVALDPATGRERWRHRFATVPPGRGLELHRPGWVPAAMHEVDGDGRPEVWVACAESGEQGAWRHGFRLLDGATGRVRWERWLAEGSFHVRSGGEIPSIRGEDVDGDGTGDLVTAWPGTDPQSGRNGLVVAAVSGRTGAILWQRHEPGVGDARSLAWWRGGFRGRPLLMVRTLPVDGGRADTLFLEARDGAVALVLPDVPEPRIADLDGDGLDDLVFAEGPGGGGRWSSIQGRMEPVWRQPGEWSAVGDLDRDGRVDFAAPAGDGLEARSGRTGAILWRTAVRLNPNHPIVPSAAGDGVCVGVVEEARPEGGVPRSTLAGFGVNDGVRRWTAAGVDLGAWTGGGSQLSWSYHYPHFDRADLDGDGAAEVLAAWLDDQDRVTWTVVFGRTGESRWSVPLPKGAGACSPRPGGLPVADFNRDGRADVALLRREAGTDGDRVVADVVDGRTGRSLWTSPFVLAAALQELAWPEPSVGDLDGDGVPEVAVVRHGGFNSAAGGYGCELVVLDGSSGLVRWVWGWSPPFPELWPPLIRPGTRTVPGSVAVGVRDPARGSAELVVLDAVGRVRTRRSLVVSWDAWRLGAQVWRAPDLDGDGAAELVYLDEGRIRVAAGPDLAARWDWGLRGESVQVAGEWEGVRDPAAGRERALVVWCGNEVWGLRGTDGRPVWRGRVPGMPMASGDDLRVVLLPGPEGGLPWLQVSGRGADHSVTGIHPAWPVDAGGRWEARRGAMLR